MHYATRTYASIAIVMLPSLALAQAPSAAQPNPAAEHLSAARSALNKVLNAPAPSGDAFKKLSEVKTHYMALEKAASTASPEWSTHYAAIDKLVGELIGAPPASAEPGAVGTSGVKGALDPRIATNLQEFRTHLTAFSAAMGGATSAPAEVTQPTPPTPAAPAPVAQATQPTPAASSASAPTPTPAAPSAPAPPAAAAQTGESSLVAQLDQVTALVDSTLAANAQVTGGTISIDRATLEQIKAQLEQIKERVKKPNP
jgi:hypothetical protein